jgi:hypothetical protein
MKNLTIFFLAFIFFVIVSCKKEAADVQVGFSDQNALSVQQELQWKGAFIAAEGFGGSTIVPDKLFIRDGYARINRGSIAINEKNYYSTSFWLTIPTWLNIKGDSINFEVRVKNPFNSSFYDPYYGRDVTLYIKGESNEASITNVVTDDINPNSKERAAIKIGQTIKNNLPQLQYNFEDYGSFILQTFNRGVVAYRNNAYLSGLPYDEEPVIGRLKEIRVTFKGSGYIDYIKIFNSVNGRLILSENFNTPGRSNVFIAR